jgi:hypothetical protein
MLEQVAVDRIPDGQECLAQVDRFLCSPIFLGSEALRKLLKYLADHTLNSPADHLKEYEIATEVFGRSSDFDPQADSCVRVQVGRLRSKLVQYYEEDGAQDPILVEIPKGRYLLSFRRRNPAFEGLTTNRPAEPELSSVVPPENENRKGIWSSYRAYAAIAILVAVFLAGGLLMRRIQNGVSAPTTAQAEASGDTAIFRTFWTPFLQNSDEPFVVFADAKFVGTAETGMRYFEPDHDAGKQVTEHYTGVGEVIGVLELDRMFEQRFGRQFEVKRGGLFTLDDALKNNLIFVGSPTENLTLNNIPGPQDFVFSQIPGGPSRGDPMIVDLHPPPGAPSTYLPTPPTLPMKVDYAIIVLMHGLDRSHWTLILAGTSTIGTQAAVDYVCSKDSLVQLLEKLGVAKASQLKPFEILLRVNVGGDVPLETQIVSLRKSQ